MTSPEADALPAFFPTTAATIRLGSMMASMSGESMPTGVRVTPTMGQMSTVPR